MNDPEPKHSQLCQCDKCSDFTPAPDMRSVLAFHASVTAPEPEHWLIKLAREVAGTPGARAALNTSFVYCVRDISSKGPLYATMDNIRAAVAALVEAEAILEGKL